MQHDLCRSSPNAWVQPLKLNLIDHVGSTYTSFDAEWWEEHDDYISILKSLLDQKLFSKKNNMRRPVILTFYNLWSPNSWPELTTPLANKLDKGYHFFSSLLIALLHSSQNTAPFIGECRKTTQFAIRWPLVTSFLMCPKMDEVLS